MRKIFIATFMSAVLIGAILLSQKPTLAAVRCETYYGGEVCVKIGELQINKKVCDPTQGECDLEKLEEAVFVDNLGLTQYTFAPGEGIIFRLEIKNVGDETFDKVYVTDTLPDYLELVSGETSFEIDNLDPDEVVTREIEARVVSADKLANDVCVVNSAETWSDDERDKDTAQVCLKKKVLGVVTIPVTGPENWLIISSLSIILALTGLFFVHKGFLA